MHDGPPVRHHSRRRHQPRQPHRLVAHLAADLRRPACRPCNHACPAGENIQGWLSHAETGDYEAAWRVLTQDNPLPAVMGRVCYHPCETACNRAQIDEAVGINSVERFLGDEAIKQRLAVHAAGDRKRQARARGRRRALRPVGRLPSAPSGPYGGDPRGRADRRRHDALRHSEIPAAAGRARCGDRSASSIMGVTLKLNAKVDEHRRDDDDARLRRRVSRRRRAHRQARLHPGRGSVEDPRRGSGAALDGRRGTSRCSAGASSSTAAAIPRSTSRAPPSGWARPRRSSSIAARATACRRTTSRSRRRSKKA